MKVQAGLILMSLIAMCSSFGKPERIYPHLDDPIVIRAYNFIVEYYKNKGDSRVQNAVAVTSATKQIVAGIKYVITVQISTSGSIDTIEYCTVPYVDQSFRSPPYVLAGNITCIPPVN